MTAARLAPGALARVTLPSPLGMGADVDLEVSALVIEREELTITVPHFYSGGGSLTAPWPLAVIAVLGADGPVLMWVAVERLAGHEANEGSSEPCAVERDAASLPRPEEPRPDAGPPALASLGPSSCEHEAMGSDTKPLGAQLQSRERVVRRVALDGSGDCGKKITGDGLAHSSSGKWTP